MPAPIPLTVSDIAFGGKGVARHEGKVFFVPFTIPGEQVSVRTVRSRKSFSEADLVSVDLASPDRTEPLCAYFGRCGGCAYQHIAYPRQLEIKASQVEQTLRRVGKLDQVPMKPVVPSRKEYHYRNRIRVHVERGVTGFYAQGSHEMVDIAECPIASPEVNAELGRLRSESVADGDYVLSGRERGPFFEQTNDGAAEALLSVVGGCLKEGQLSLVDAYCGGGFFAHHFADRFARVIGIEENPHAIEYAIRCAGPHESYITGGVAERLSEVLPLCQPASTSVILDPPAAGLEPRVTDILLGAAVSEIIYVSCNPATLARDLASLCRGAYSLASVTPVDMFPQTSEIEVVAHMRLS